MNQSTTCLQPSELQLLLEGDMPPLDQSAAEEHLATCASCRQTIESSIGSQQWWEIAEESLRCGNLVEEATSGDATQESTASQLLELLGPTDDPDMLGRIGPYEVVGILGRGGMGAVFKAFDAALNRFVAIKVLLPHLSASGAARKRFSREAQAAAAVIDDHVMAIHGVSQWQGHPYFVMPYARGVSLQRRLADDGPLKPREILRIGMQTARALAAAHAQGIVHRDVKPANIFLEEGVERVQLMDFGLARAIDDASLTRIGTLAGTPHYMSPEQARAESVDTRSDLFSLGAVLYATCTAHAPFRAETSYAVLRLIVDTGPRPINEINPDIPEWLCAIIGKLMSKQAEDRFASAAEVAELLEDCLAHVQQPATVPLPWRKLPACDSAARQGGSLPHERQPWRNAQWLIGLAAFAFAILVAGVVIVLETNKGTLTIESEADNVPIRITQGDKVVEKLTVSKSGESVRIAAGEYVVEIEGEADGIIVENGTVELRRRGEWLARIAVKEQTVAEALDAQDYGEPATTDEVIVDLYCGSDVLPRMNTMPPNEVARRHIKLLQALNAIKGVTTNFRATGPGEEIHLAIVLDPSQRHLRESAKAGKPSSVKTAIDSALKAAGVPGVRWEEYKARGEVPGSIDSDPTESHIRNQFETQVTPRFNRRPLREFADYIAREAGINVLLDERGLAAEGITADEPVTLEVIQPIRISSALKIVLEPLHLEYVIEHEVLRITSDQLAYRLVTKAYDVADLVGADSQVSPMKPLPETNQTLPSPVYTTLDGLINLITATIAPESWDAVGGRASAQAFPDDLSLVILQTEIIHEQIEAFLFQLRELERKTREPRRTAERFLAALLSDKVVATNSLSEDARQFKEVLASDRLDVDSIHVNQAESRALVVTTEAKLKESEPDSRRSGYLVITLETQNNNWTIKDIDFETQTSAREEVRRFLADESDLDRLQGAWQCVALIMFGSGEEPDPLPDDEVRGYSLSFSGRQFKIKDLYGVRSGEFKLSGTTSPKHIDLLVWDGIGVDTRLGIYKFHSGELWLSLSEDESRPTTFEPKDSPNEYLMRFRRPVNKEEVPADVDSSNIEAVSPTELAWGTPLLDAILEFNRQYQDHEIGKSRPPVTDDEVIASIRWAVMLDGQTRVSDPYRQQLGYIAEHRQLPQGWAFQVVTEVEGVDGERFQAWFIRLVYSGTPGVPPYTHAIRDQLLWQLNADGEPVVLGKRETTDDAADSKPLAAAIHGFNASHRQLAGFDMPPLTEQEVIAAIRYQKAHRSNFDITDGEFARMQQIADTRRLPADAEVSVLTGYQPGDGYRYDIWSVRFSMRKQVNTVPYPFTGFTIREHYVRSQSLDLDKIAWGPVAKNGLQAGVRFEPRQASYFAGQRVTPYFYYRNTRDRKLDISFPNIESGELVAVDNAGLAIPVDADEKPKWIVGAMGFGKFGFGSQHEIRGRKIVLGEAERGDAEFAIRAKAGQAVRVHFVLSNYGDKRGSQLKTGEVVFSITDKLSADAPAIRNLHLMVGEGDTVAGKLDPSGPDFGRRLLKSFRHQRITLTKEIEVCEARLKQVEASLTAEDSDELKQAYRESIRELQQTISAKQSELNGVENSIAWLVVLDKGEKASGTGDSSAAIQGVWEVTSYTLNGNSLNIAGGSDHRQ